MFCLVYILQISLWAVGRAMFPSTALFVTSSFKEC